MISDTFKSFMIIFLPNSDLLLKSYHILKHISIPIVSAPIYCIAFRRKCVSFCFLFIIFSIIIYFLSFLCPTERGLLLSLRQNFRSACFSKILRIGFCENKKADAISSFTKIQNTSAQSFDLIGHYSFFLTGSYRPFLIMSKAKGTNFLRLMPFCVNHY